MVLSAGGYRPGYLSSSTVGSATGSQTVRPESRRLLPAPAITLQANEFQARWTPSDAHRSNSFDLFQSAPGLVCETAKIVAFNRGSMLPTSPVETRLCG
jgi:hypothetical protein